MTRETKSGNGFKSLKEVVQAMNIDPKTFKSHLKQKDPILYATMFKPGRRKMLISPLELKGIESALGEIK